ncbi:MAG TPA: hypothetical protein VGB62_04075, partial [Allosphingosinicella sp.]
LAIIALRICSKLCSVIESQSHNCFTDAIHLLGSTAFIGPRAAGQADSLGSSAARASHCFSAAHCKGAKAAVPGCLSDSGQERPMPHSGISG